MKLKSIILVVATIFVSSISFAADHPVVGWWASQTCTVSSAKDETESACRISVLIMDDGGGKMSIIFNNGGGGHTLNFEVKGGLISGQDAVAGTLTSDTMDITFSGHSQIMSHFKITSTTPNAANVEWTEAYYAPQGDIYYINANVKK